MAKVTILAGHNPAAIAHFAGSARVGQLVFNPETLDLEVADVTQPDLDTALADYIADQAGKDADFADKLADDEKDRNKDKFDEKDDLTALIKVVVEELNVLRALHSLPDLNFGQVNASIRQRIGNP